MRHYAHETYKSCAQREAAAGGHPARRRAHLLAHHGPRPRGIRAPSARRQDPGPRRLRSLAGRPRLDEAVTCLPVVQEVLQGFREESAFRLAREGMLSLPIVESPLRAEVFEEKATKWLCMQSSPIMPACSTRSEKSPGQWTRLSGSARGRSARASTASRWRPSPEGPVWWMLPWPNATSATSPGPGARIPSSIERSRLSIASKKASGAEARPRHQPLHGPLSRLARGR